MRRQGARLTVSGALGRQTALDPLQTSGQTNSASLSKAEKEIKVLKGENYKLRKELEDVRSLYNQIVQENTHERFDERRVTLLKSQVIQLERQILLMSEALSARSETLLEVENALTWLADKFRSYITKEVKGPDVNVARSDLTLMVETAESARIKLYKQLENRTTEKLSRQLLFYNEFIHPSLQNDVTLLDVASGSLEHLNLKQVTKLETKLSTLYRELISLHSALDQDQEANQAASSCMWTSCHVTLAARERLMTQILKSCAIIKDCTCDLLDLSLLFPAAPWPPLKKSALKEVTAERVLKCLPGMARSKSTESQKIIQALVKAYNYKVFMLNSQIQSLREEVKYHHKVYNLQLKYTESLFQAIREGYSQFEESTSEVIVKPLKDILEAYVNLNHTASETALKVFLKKFKDQAPQFGDIVETLAVTDEESEGSKLLSSYGEEFFSSLEKLVHDHQVKRDREANHIEEIREEQARLDQELREILEEQESRSHDISLNLTGRDDSFEHKQSQNMSKDIVNIKKEKSFHLSTSRTEKEIKSKDKEVRQDENPPALDTRWESNLRSEKKTKVDSVKQKRPEWNNDFTDDISNMTIDDPESFIEKGSNTGLNQGSLSGPHSFSGFNNQDMQDSELDTNISGSEANSEPADAKSLNQNDSKPPKSKKKLGYVPNTFVPNRTLQLRRSGSLNRLVESKPDKFSDQSATGSNKTEEQSREGRKTSGKQEHVRSLSRDRAKLPPKKPAFK